jgi:hypothetical protein
MPGSKKAIEIELSEDEQTNQARSFMTEWNQTVHPFLWTEPSFENIRRKFSAEKRVTFPQSEQKAA